VATVLVVATQNAAEAAFPGKNGRIAFALFPEVGDAEIHTMRPDGSGLRPVTNNSATTSARPGPRTAPSFPSPDSRRSS
jgi:hypothetical protein